MCDDNEDAKGQVQSDCKYKLEPQSFAFSHSEMNINGQLTCLGFTLTITMFSVSVVVRRTTGRS